MSTAVDKPECSILEQLTEIYISLDESYGVLLTLSGNRQKNDESLEESGVIPKVWHLVLRMGGLASDMSTEIHRIKVQLGSMSE